MMRRLLVGLVAMMLMVGCGGAQTPGAGADGGAASSDAGATNAPAEVLATGIDCPSDLVVDDTDAYAVVHAKGTGDDVPMDIVRAPKNGAGVKTFVGRQFLMTRLALDATHVYWNQVGTGRNGAIRRLAKTGKAIEDFAVLRPSIVSGLAVDDQNVYWGGYEIARQGKAQTSATIIGGSPLGTRTFAADATHAYFSVGDDQMLIARVPLAGGATTKVVAAAMSPSNTSYMQAKQVAVDGAFLYWTADLAGGLNRVAKDGTGSPSKVFSYFPNDRRFAIDGSNIFWAESDGSVKWAPKDGSGGVTTLYTGSPITGMEWGFPIAVDAARVYWGFCGGIRSAPKPQ